MSNSDLFNKNIIAVGKQMDFFFPSLTVYVYQPSSSVFY